MCGALKMGFTAPLMKGSEPDYFWKFHLQRGFWNLPFCNSMFHLGGKTKNIATGKTSWAIISRRFFSFHIVFFVFVGLFFSFLCFLCFLLFCLFCLFCHKYINTKFVKSDGFYNLHIIWSISLLGICLSAIYGACFCGALGCSSK